MSGGEWKPGDVALVLNEHGVWNRAICAVRAGHRGFVWSYGVADDSAPLTAEARPLIVIDPVEITGPDETCDLDPRDEIGKCLERLAEREGATVFGGSYRGRIAARLAVKFSHPAPPIDEPTGLGAVVEDDCGDQWVRVNAGAHRWQCGDSTRYRWSDLDNPVRVLSPGVTP